MINTLYKKFSIYQRLAIPLPKKEKRFPRPSLLFPQGLKEIVEGEGKEVTRSRNEGINV